MIKALDISQSIEWDYAVKKVPNYDVFYLSNYLKAFYLQGSGTPLLIVYSDGRDYAINAVFCRDVADDKNFKGKLPKNTYYDLSTPYGYGGWIGIISNYEKLLKEWEEYCREKKFISEFVRFELFTDYYKYFGGEVESRTHNVVRSLDMSLEQMWMDFKPKVRKNVKRANTYNLRVIRDSEGKYLDDFLKIYYLTMDRNSAEKEYYFNKNFYETLNEMKDNIIYFHVVCNDKETGKDSIISSELVIYGAENCYSYLGGTDNKYFEMRPNDFLKYEIIKWGIEKGLKNFVLGGGYGSDDGIFQYKKNLAPNGIVDFYIGKKIFNKQVYSELVELRTAENPVCKNSSFFPQYRA